MLLFFVSIKDVMASQRNGLAARAGLARLAWMPALFLASRARSEAAQPLTAKPVLGALLLTHANVNHVRFFHTFAKLYCREKFQNSPQ